MARIRAGTEDSVAAEVFRANVSALMSQARQVEVRREDIAAKARISLRSLGYQLQGKHSPTLRTIEAVASAFGLQPWQLLLPGLSVDLLLDKSVAHTLGAYLSASAPERHAIDKVVDLLEHRQRRAT